MPEFMLSSIIIYLLSETRIIIPKELECKYLSYGTSVYICNCIFVSSCFSKPWVEDAIVWFRCFNYSKYNISIILKKAKYFLGKPFFPPNPLFFLGVVFSPSLFSIEVRLSIVQCKDARGFWTVTIGNVLLSCTWQTHGPVLMPILCLCVNLYASGGNVKFYGQE